MQGGGRTFYHPGTAARDNLIECEIFEDIVFVYSARRHELYLRESRAKRFHSFQTAEIARGEEFKHVYAERQRLHYFGRRYHAGQIRHSAIFAHGSDFFAESRGNDELGACVYRALALLPVNHRTRADKHVGVLLYGKLYAFLGAVRAERDFRNGQSSADERVEKRLGVLYLLYYHNGNYFISRDLFVNIHDYSLR